MRKSRDGGKNTRKKGEKMGEKDKRLMIIVATTSLPAVDRPNADRWNAANSCQNTCKFTEWTYLSPLANIQKSKGTLFVHFLKLKK